MRPFAPTETNGEVGTIILDRPWGEAGRTTQRVVPTGKHVAAKSCSGGRISIS